MASHAVDDLIAENGELRARVVEAEAQLQRVRRHDASGEVLLSRRDAELTALHQTAIGLMHTTDVDDVLTTIVTSVAQLLGTTHGYGCLLHPTEYLLEIRLGIGCHYGFAGRTIMLGEGISGKVWQSGQPMIVPNYATWRYRMAQVSQFDFHTIVAVPLMRHETAIGVIGLSFDTIDKAIEAESVDMLTRFAQLAAIAIDRAALFADAQRELAERRTTEAALRVSEQKLRDLYLTAQRQARELDLLGQVRAAIASELDLQTIVRLVVEAVVSVFGYTQVSVYMLKGEILHLRHQVGYASVIDRVPITRGVSGRVVRSATPVLIEDVRTEPEFLGAIDGISSEICVPLLTRSGDVIGTLNVESIDGVRLTSDDLTLMVALAEHVSIAVYRAQLHSAAQRQVAELETLRTTLTEIAANLDLDQLIKAILERQVALLRATSGEISLYDESARALNVVMSYNMGHDWSGTRLELGEGMMGHVALTREPLVVTNYQRWTGRSAHYARIVPMAGMVVPMLAGDRLVGVLGVGDVNLERVFDADDLRMLSLFAQQATIAIQNARLFAAARDLASTDALTRLLNRYHFFDRAEQLIVAAASDRLPISALMLDIDNFKQINDTYGHIVGDMALRAVGQRVRETLSDGAIACRYGGEEIVALLPGADEEAAAVVAERVRAALALPIDGAPQGCSITGSIGVACAADARATTIDALIDCADRAQYRAKRAGKNRVMRWSAVSGALHDGAAVATRRP